MKVGSAFSILAGFLAFLGALAPSGACSQERFDHFSTGFDLDGAHVSVPCERCHTGGTFEGTTPTCVGCHSQFGTVRASARPLGHPATSEVCSDCHTTAAWTPVAFMDHADVRGSCGSCHNGTDATGKHPTHIITSDNCDDCHVSTAWVPARFDHADIFGSCVSCHNGIEATGKDLNHIATTDVCEDCHSTAVWEPATAVDHTQVVGTCASCHNGTIATGKHPTHIASGNNCDDCHTTNAWVPATFDHAGITAGCFACHNGTDATGKDPNHINTTNICEDCHSPITWTPAIRVDHTQVLGSCSSCHNGTDATGKDPGHFITNQECDTCHDNLAWIPHIYMHAGLSYEPLDHRGNLDCTDCHQANSEAVQWPTAAYQPDCAGCHANDFKPDPHKKYENPDMRYTVGELRNCSGACHVYTDASMTTIKDSRPGPEHRISDGEF